MNYKITDIIKIYSEQKEGEWEQQFATHQVPLF